MCIRCKQEDAPERLGLCATCALHTRIELSEGFRDLAGYLACWASFTSWLEERGLE